MRSQGTILFAVLLAAATAAQGESATVYERTAPDGVPEFTDHSVPGAKTEVIQAPNLMDPVTPLPQTQSSTPPDKAPRAPEITIVSPTPQQSIWSGNGDISVAFSVRFATAGLRYQVFLDGQSQGTIADASLMLRNVFRGQHAVKVDAVDASGKVVASSPGVVFYVHRPSIN